MTFLFSLAGGLLLAFILIPLARMYLTHGPAGLARMAMEPGVRSAIGLSLEAALITSLLAGLLGTPLAYLLSRTSFPGKGLVAALVDLPLAVPHSVVGIALLFVFGRAGFLGAPLEKYLGLKFWGTLGGIVIAMLFVSAPYMVNSARIGFDGVDPRLEKVARTLGHGPWTVFARVTLPLARHGILTGLMLTYARSISEFGAVVILAYFPMTAPVKIYDLFLQSGLEDSSAVAVLFLTVALALFVLFRRLARGIRTREGNPHPGPGPGPGWERGAGDPERTLRAGGPPRACRKGTAPALELESLSLTLGGFQLRDVAFSLPAGETLVILGPSAAGKSVLLETLAGFNLPDRGRILLHGRDITRAPLERRRIGFMFQDYALFPHLTVAGNIAFGLRGRHGDGRRRVGELLARLGLEPVAQRKPALLSGGEKQRVALARALASDPELFLFDEPLSALDANTRDGVRDDLRNLLREVGIPAIYVTHDQGEALVLADRLAVLQGGRLAQAGTPAQVFDAPANRFVARFVGVENLLPGRVTACGEGHCSIRTEHGAILRTCRNRFPPGAQVLACLRPEDVTILPGDAPEPPLENRLEARVAAIASLGAVLRVRLDCGFSLSASLTRQTLRALGIREGDPVRVAFPAEAVHLVDGSGPET